MPTKNSSALSSEREPVSADATAAETGGPKRRRRAVRNRKGFGYLLDAALDHTYRIKSEDLTYTAFLEKVAEKANVSLRHLVRLRSQPHMPELGVLERLSESVPLLKTFVDEWATSARLNWESVELDQKALPVQSTITIVSGFEKPRGIGDDPSSAQIAEQVAINIHKKEIIYCFIYPTVPELKSTVANALTQDGLEISNEIVDNWINELQERVFMNLFRLYSKREGYQVEALLAESKKRIRLLRTNNDPMSAFFWSYAPRYLVLYNLDATDSRFASKQYGMFWEKGLLPFADINSSDASVVKPVSAHGWTYLFSDEYRRIALLLRNGGILNKKLPVPGQEIGVDQGGARRRKTPKLA